MSSFVQDLWIGVGGAVERELDDVSNIWTAGWITAVNLEDGSIDVVYEDGSLEDHVPIDEIRAQPPALPTEPREDKALAALLVQEASPLWMDGAASQDEGRLAIISSAGGAPLSPKKPAARSLASSLRALRCQAKRLTESVATLRGDQETQLARLSAACLGAVRGMKSMRTTRRALGELAERVAASAQHVERPLPSRKAARGEFDDVQALCESSLTSETAARPESRTSRRRPNRAGTPTSEHPSTHRAERPPTHGGERRSRSSAGTSAMAMDLEQSAGVEAVRRPQLAERQKPMSQSQHRHASASVGATRVTKASPAFASSRTRVQHPLDWGMPGFSARPKFGGAF